MSTLKEEDLRRFSVSDGTLTLEETLLDRQFGRLRAVVIGPDGALYVSTANGGDDRILRITATRLTAPKRPDSHQVTKSVERTLRSVRIHAL